MSVPAGARTAAFERAIATGGVVLFPSDTVYGLACDPSNAAAISWLYSLKGRSPAKAAAVMFFDLDVALAAVPELGEWTRGALRRLMPGALTALVPNPAGRFPLACGEDPETLGLRVVSVPELAGTAVGVLQSSANLAGEADPRSLQEVPESIRAAVALEIDGGELPGRSSTVVDLRRYEGGRCGGGWSVVRAGAVSEEQLSELLDGQYHFNPATYEDMIREDLPEYGRLQDELVASSAGPARRILDLGTGTGETAARLLAAHPDATLVGIDESEAMLSVARARLGAGGGPGAGELDAAGSGAARAELVVARLQNPLPSGPFDLVASALCVHHLTGEEKAELFLRIRDVLSEGGRFVLADVVIPGDPAGITAALTPGYDKPSTVVEQLEWLAAAGFDARVRWESGDLAVIVADLPG